jgi:hypothetical protein
MLQTRYFKYFELRGDRIADPVGLVLEYDYPRILLADILAHHNIVASRRFRHLFFFVFNSIWVLFTRLWPDIVRDPPSR